MTCYSPMKGYIAKNGQFTFNKNRCLIPDLPKEMTVACGKCLGCKMDYSRAWATRATHENLTSDREGCFLTLTYDEEHIPSNRGLQYSHIQTFNKAYRTNIKRKEDAKYKFLAVGEYGGQTQRPHYHMCMFNYKPNDLELWKLAEDGETKYFISPSLTKQWGHGYVVVGELTWQSAAYTARYSMKKIGGNEIYFNEETGEVLTNTMLRCSKGIGKKFVHQYLESIYPHDYIVLQSKTGSYKIKPPRYYDKMLEKINPEMYKEVKEKRKEKAIENEFTDEELNNMLINKRKELDKNSSFLQ